MWLIGAGPMARDYGLVLQDIGTDYEVIGRGQRSAETLSRMLRAEVYSGGLENHLTKFVPPSTAIVAVGVVDLVSTTCTLLTAGVKRILVEKPAGLDVNQIKVLDDAARDAGAEVFVGFNRRFYASTLKAESLVAEDGGVLSAHFEFTEWSHIIKELDMDPMVKENWVLANSSHVIDLAFHFCGLPENLHAMVSGNLSWHSSAARFSGVGKTNRGVLLSYFADWESSGRWSLELLTKNRRLFMSPMEELRCSRLGSVDIDKVTLDDRLDRAFKPGLHRQVAAFLTREDSRLCRLEEHLKNSFVYSQIAGYRVPV